MVSLLRLSHSVHFAVWTLTTVMRVGSEEQVRSLPLAAWMNEPGVLSATALGEDAEVGEEALGVAGRGMTEFVGTNRSGGDGVFSGEDMLTCRFEPKQFRRDVAQAETTRSDTQVIDQYPILEIWRVGAVLGCPEN
jgi:hypothetical protein